MEHILLPSKMYFEPGQRPHEGVLVVEPCFHGYGTTLGNALRRVLLSSLPGAAVTAIKIKGVTHEFQSIEHVKEDVLEIILNVKALRLKLHSDQPVKLSLKVEGAKAVTGADIDPNAEVEIVNTDQVICTTTDASSKFEMELTVEKGRGYVPTEEREHESHDLGTIAIDALFSPVRSVGYRVENTRIGDITNYDKLIMNIETDGSLTPEEAVQASAQLLIDHFALLTGGLNSGEMPATEAPVEAEESPEEPVESSEE